MSRSRTDSMKWACMGRSHDPGAASVWVERLAAPRVASVWQHPEPSFVWNPRGPQAVAARTLTRTGDKPRSREATVGARLRPGPEHIEQNPAAS